MIFRILFLTLLIIYGNHVVAQKLNNTDYNSVYNAFTEYNQLRYLDFSDRSNQLPKYKGVETSFDGNYLKVNSLTGSSVLVDFLERDEQVITYEHEVFLENPTNGSSVYFSFYYNSNTTEKFIFKYDQINRKYYFEYYKNNESIGIYDLDTPKGLSLPKYPTLTVRAQGERIYIFINGLFCNSIILDNGSNWKYFHYGYSLTANKAIVIGREKCATVKFSLDNTGDDNPTKYFFDAQNETSFRTTNNELLILDKDKNRLHFLFFTPLEFLGDLEEILKEMIPSWQLKLDPVVKIFVTDSYSKKQFETNIGLLFNYKKINIVRPLAHFLPIVDYTEPWVNKEEGISFAFYLPETPGYFNLVKLGGERDCQIADPISEVVQNFKDNAYFLDKDWKITCEKNASFKREILKKGNLNLVKDYYWPSRKTQMIGQYSSMFPGLREGTFTWYYENGQISRKSNYSKGQLNGSHELFTKEGKISRKENYLNGTLHGLSESYFNNSKLRYRGKYVNGLLDSIEVHYHDNGKLFARTEHKNGMLFNRLEVNDYYGRKLPFGNLKDGNGELIVYRDFGFLPTSIKTYSNGEAITIKSVFADQSVMATVKSLDVNSPDYNKLELNVNDFILKFNEAIANKSLGPIREFIFLPTVKENLSDPLRNKKFLSYYFAYKFADNEFKRDSLIKSIQSWDADRFKSIDYVDIETFNKQLTRIDISKLNEKINKANSEKWKFKMFRQAIIENKMNILFEDNYFAITLVFDSLDLKTTYEIDVHLLATPYGWVIYGLDLLQMK